MRAAQGARAAARADGRFRISWDASLVEAAVLAAEGLLSRLERARFRSDRDRVYEEPPDEREALFEEIHARCFVELGLDRPLHEALAETPELSLRTSGVFVGRAAARREEAADLCEERSAPKGAPPAIVLRLRPESLLRADALRALLRRELLHVADMLDPGFGYARELEVADADPALVKLLRARYRVVWEATIDGRLFHRGLLDADVRAARLAEFARAFPVLGERTEAAFASFFDGSRPSHPAIAVFIQEPLGPGSLGETRCPLCRLPACGLERVDEDLAHVIERDKAGWRPEHGCCSRCREVYATLRQTNLGVPP